MKKSRRNIFIVGSLIITVAIIIIAIFGIINTESKNILHTNVPKELDKAVIQLIFDDNNGNYNHNNNSACKTEGHEIFCYEIDENKVKVYGYMNYTELNFMNGYLCYFNGGGMSAPFVAEFEIQNNKYINGSMKYPMDGSYYTDSIKEMFPGVYAVKALNYDNSSYLKSQQEAYAKEYLDSMGFDCKIALHPDDFDVRLLPAADTLPDGNSGHSMNYPFWLGTQMFYENGKWMVYAQFYNEKEQKAYLTAYENGATQAEAEVYALNDRNATYIGKETIDVYPFFEDKNINSIDNLPETQETTSMITLE